MKTAIIVFLILASILCVFTIIVVLVDMLRNRKSQPQEETPKEDEEPQKALPAQYYNYYN